MVAFAEFVSVFLQVCAYGVEAVIPLLFFNTTVVDVVSGVHVGRFAIGSTFVFDDVAAEVFWRFVGVAVADGFLGFCKVLQPFLPLIVKVFQGE